MHVSDEVGEPTVPSPVDAFGLDVFRFIEEQKRTPWTLALRAFLEEELFLWMDNYMASHYVKKNAVLVRRVHLRARAGPACTTLVHVIPLRRSYTTVTRGALVAFGHYENDRQVCGNGKGYRPWKNGTMQRMLVVDLSEPFSLLVVDAIGPLVITPRENKYIVAFVDYFTPWVETFPVKRLDTVTFMNWMVDEVVSRYGVPERLLSDRDANFISNLAMSFYQTLVIRKLFGAAYHP
ncbi:Integrase, catalytic core protein [Phytophthora megakarya]|uniref:Integrase, catalytic core protein n=1 Tax=Phytophthora megakarya TaxID=4795 RepID=A0A225VUC7_9STRA|nr:Integrase, catalytic core protein [Phytophthora megakarya]